MSKSPFRPVKQRVRILVLKILVAGFALPLNLQAQAIFDSQTALAMNLNPRDSFFEYLLFPDRAKDLYSDKDATILRQRLDRYLVEVVIPYINQLNQLEADFQGKLTEPLGLKRLRSFVENWDPNYSRYFFGGAKADWDGFYSRYPRINEMSPTEKSLLVYYGTALFIEDLSKTSWLDDFYDRLVQKLPDALYFVKINPGFRRELEWSAQEYVEVLKGADGLARRRQAASIFAARRKLDYQEVSFTWDEFVKKLDTGAADWSSEELAVLWSLKHFESRQSSAAHEWSADEVADLKSAVDSAEWRALSNELQTRLSQLAAPAWLSRAESDIKKQRAVEFFKPESLALDAAGPSAILVGASLRALTRGLTFNWAYPRSPSLLQKQIDLNAPGSAARDYALSAKSRVEQRRNEVIDYANKKWPGSGFAGELTQFVDVQILGRYDHRASMLFESCAGALQVAAANGGSVADGQRIIQDQWVSMPKQHNPILSATHGLSQQVDEATGKFLQEKSGSSWWARRLPWGRYQGLQRRIASLNIRGASPRSWLSRPLEGVWPAMSPGEGTQALGRLWLRRLGSSALYGGALTIPGRAIQRTLEWNQRSKVPVDADISEEDFAEMRSIQGSAMKTSLRELQSELNARRAQQGLPSMRFIYDERSSSPPNEELAYSNFIYVLAVVDRDRESKDVSSASAKIEDALQGQLIRFEAIAPDGDFKTLRYRPAGIVPMHRTDSYLKRKAEQSVRLDDASGDSIWIDPEAAKHLFVP